MSYLYENEDISVYNPSTDDYDTPKAVSNKSEEIQQRAAAVHQMMQGPGWLILKKYLDECAELHTNNLINSQEMNEVSRLQAAIKVSKSIESFLNSVIWEASVTEDNS